ncbi:uncharacterized protein LOC111018561 [Momordica charantia]|uniref:Uncharacterized protein LOC111018561 n=1 Tax=Momordica charantia TaxID=3673 RepID=A0A6J1D8C0_MOMCH|nr:uncharacterized protein LOC111018561 [Momordica charantia]
MVQPAKSANTTERRGLNADNGPQRDLDARMVEDQKKRASREPEDSPSYSREFSNSDLKAQSKYKPLTPEAVITREEFDLMKHRFDEQVEALKVRHKEGETLKEYVTRFQEEQLKVAHCSDDSAMCYFLTGLADETLTVKLGEEAPATFAEVLQKAKKVIDGQELLRTKTGRPEKQIDQKKLNQEKRKVDSKPKDKGSSSSVSRIDCWELKRQIEDLIQDGYFKKFVGKPRFNSVEKKEERKRSRTPPRRDDRPAVINTIFGGPSGGQSGNKRKELVREARREVFIIREQRSTCSITFDDTDLEGVHLPHNDALVITPLINHVLVRRVLVDGGASANILSLPTYLALGWTRSQLKKSPTPLVGFYGESVSPEGCIDLPVTVGQDAT